VGPGRVRVGHRKLGGASEPSDVVASAYLDGHLVSPGYEVAAQ
jgi:hypothetical protein